MLLFDAGDEEGADQLNVAAAFLEIVKRAKVHSPGGRDHLAGPIQPTLN